MDFLRELKRRAEQAEAFLIESETTSIGFEANQVKSAEIKETQGIALRAIIDGKLGFSAASGEVDAQELLDNVVVSAKYGEDSSLQFPEPRDGVGIATYEPALAELQVADLVEMGREIVEGILDIDHDANVDVDIERSLDLSELQNSAGAQIERQSSQLRISASIERVRGDDVLIIYDSLSDTGPTDEYRSMVQRLGRKLTLAREAASLSSGRMPVLFSPSAAPVLVLPLMLALNGQNVQRGVSPLADQLGDKVFSSKLSVWDDPTIIGRPNSANHDDEGVPCRRKALIKQGTCHEFVYDLKTAALMGTDSSGNGGRSLFSPPSPSISNLIIESGDTPVQRIISSIEEGLLVESVLGLGQGNPISGAFSNTVGLAYVIRGGDIVGRVKDVSIAGNVYQDLQEIAALSVESEWIHGHYRSPYILLSQLNVVSKT